VWPGVDLVVAVPPPLTAGQLAPTRLDLRVGLRLEADRPVLPVVAWPGQGLSPGGQTVRATGYHTPGVISGGRPPGQGAMSRHFRGRGRTFLIPGG